jgi:hypothetical protein
MFLLLISSSIFPSRGLHLQFLTCPTCHLTLWSKVGFLGILFDKCQSLLIFTTVFYQNPKKSVEKLPSSEIIIIPDLGSIMEDLQNIYHVGELKQGWKEIKKLQLSTLNDSGLSCNYQKSV